MAKLNKLHKRKLRMTFGISYLEGHVYRASNEEMTMECDIPRRWSNKDIFDFANAHIGRRGQTTETKKDFKVTSLNSITVVFPDDFDREIKLLEPCKEKS
ncbi:MAG: hypothetical protein IK076_08665 [Bacteroidales bacterium]|nr:hypothetical protein [Bacteroidales bacterium]